MDSSSECSVLLSTHALFLLYIINSFVCPSGLPIISHPCSGSPQISQSLPPCVLTNVQCGQTRSFAPPAAKPSPCPPESRAIWSNTSGGMSSSIGACVDPEGADPAGRDASKRRQWTSHELRSQTRTDCLSSERHQCLPAVRADEGIKHSGVVQVWRSRRPNEHFHVILRVFRPAERIIKFGRTY